MTHEPPAEGTRFKLAGRRQTFKVHEVKRHAETPMMPAAPIVVVLKAVAGYRAGTWYTGIFNPKTGEIDDILRF